MAPQNYNTGLSSSVGNYMHDAEPSVQLRTSLTPVTVNGVNAALDISLKAAGQAMANITIASAVDTDATEGYTLILEADAVGGFGGNEIVVGTMNIPATFSGSLGIPFYGPGIVRLLVAAGIIADDNADTAIQLRHVLVGTAPSLVYTAQVGPVIGGL